MQFNLLPPTLVLLLLSITSTNAAPVPPPESSALNCGAISFLSPRYQSILGLRKYCSAVHELDVPVVTRSLPDVDDLSQTQPDMMFGPPDELFPADQLEAQSNKLRQLNVDLELDLARARQGLSQQHEYLLKSMYFAQLGRLTWGDFQRRARLFLLAIEDIHEHVALVGSSAVVCVVLVLMALELFIAKRKLRQQRMRQRVMRQVVRRGTRIRVKRHPFHLATITEESQKQLLPIKETPHWDEKSQYVASLTPTC